MRYLVTGGAGFIGSAVVRRVLSQGAEVVVLDDFSTGKESNLSGVHGRLTLVRGSITNPVDVRRAMAGCKGVFHLAAVASVQRSMNEPIVCHDVNVTGALCILQAAKDLGVQRVVLSSSAATYGELDTFPLTEEMSGMPISPYGVHKLFDEYYARLYANSGWTQAVCLRYFNVFGPRQDPNGEYAAVVPKFVAAALSGKKPVIFGDGKQSRDFLFVEDVARANWCAMTSPVANGHVYNVCAGHESSLLQLLEALSAAMGSPVVPDFQPARTGDIRRSVGSPEAARSIGFSAEVSLEEGLGRTLDYFRSITP